MIVGATSWEGARDVLNWAGPVSLGIACLVTAYSIVAARPLSLWTPVPWLLAAVAAYCGLGPLVYAVGDASVTVANSLWPADATDLWRTNLLNTVGILVIVVAYLAGTKLVAAWCPAASDWPSAHSWAQRTVATRAKRRMER